ncbi:hypothetical protein B0H13DRAFT_1873127 [Mycena leptocephala]|nr:hypothetical protein B0H13DRAFT_1873127 [Mycena leptocephala]
MQQETFTTPHYRHYLALYTYGVVVTVVASGDDHVPDARAKNAGYIDRVIGHQARGPDQHCFEPKEGMPPASTLMAASPAIYTPPNAPHTPLARKSARFASSASPRIDVVADSPVHNRAMLSLGPDTSITSLTFMPPTPKTSLATVVQAPGPSPGRLNFSLQQLESESQKIRLEIRAKEQEDKATPKT